MIAVLVIAAAAAALLCGVAVFISRAIHRGPARTYRDRYFVTPFEARAPFEPVPLYAKLGRDGFSHQSRQVEDGSWQIEFRRA